MNEEKYDKYDNYYIFVATLKDWYTIPSINEWTLNKTKNGIREECPYGYQYYQLAQG